MLRKDIEVSTDIVNNLERFIKLYSEFSNDLDLTSEIGDAEKTLFDWLKKYKLASSEGLNKHTNRNIRYNVMKDFMFELSDDLQKAEDSLYEKMVAANVEIVEDPEE